MFDSRLALPGTVARLPRKCHVRLWVLNCRDWKCSKAGPGCSFSLLLAGELPRGSPDMRYGSPSSLQFGAWAHIVSLSSGHKHIHAGSGCTTSFPAAPCSLQPGRALC